MLGEPDLKHVAGGVATQACTPHLGFSRLMEHLGAALLRQLAGPHDETRSVGGIIIHDPGDPMPLTPDSIVLCVGVRDSAQLMPLVTAAVEHHVVALVVREPFDLAPEVADAAVGGHVNLLGLAPGATWHQLTTLLTVALAEPSRDQVSPDTLGGFASGDLFGIASAICELIDAPVTIEDAHSNVLAFSHRQDEADFIRVEAILGRRTPQSYIERDETRGAIREIRRATAPVFLQALQLGGDRETLPRVCIPVRAGDEFLGTIWAVVRHPLSPEGDRLLIEASHLVALHLLQLRAGADVSRRLRMDLVATALEGGLESASALARLGLGERPVVVAALAVRPPASSSEEASAQGHAQRSSDLQRAAAALALHLSPAWTDSAVAVVGETAYAIVGASRPQDVELNLETSCRSFIRQREGQWPLVAGIGRIAYSADQVRLSREDADRTLRVLRLEGERRVAVRAVDVEVDAYLLHLRDLTTASGRGPTGPYAALLAHDEKRGSGMVDTVRAWLDHHGDIGNAAAATYVHPNTFRYRLKRMSEVGGFDLDDAAARFAISLQMRIFPPPTGPSQPE